MHAPDPVVAATREWVVKAENDLTNAAHTLTLGAECPTDTVCFHAQQCIEKYIKALLIFNKISFSKTHEITVLCALMPTMLCPKLDAKVQERLTEYATVERYPNEAPEITLIEARRAVAVARRVRKEMRSRLPLAALRRAKK